MGDVLTLRIREVVRATPSARVIRVDLDVPFRYRAGQAAIIGTHGQSRRKPYSIASAPEEAERQGYLEFLLKVDSSGNPGSHLAVLQKGAKIDLEGPVGSFQFPDRPSERTFLFVAGGTGIAPLRAMIYHALIARTPGRLALLYSARAPDDFAYGPELRRLARAKKLELGLTVTGDAGSSWKGERGRINLQRLSPLVGDPARTLCFICGPPSLLESAPRLLRQVGVPQTKIRMEER